MGSPEKKGYSCVMYQESLYWKIFPLLCASTGLPTKNETSETIVRNVYWQFPYNPDTLGLKTYCFFCQIKQYKATFRAEELQDRESLFYADCAKLLWASAWGLLWNEFHPNLGKTTSSVLSVILINLWYKSCICVQ